MKTNSKIVIPELEKIAETNPPQRPWTEEEDAVLMAYRGKVTARDLSRYLTKKYPPGRTVSAVQHRLVEV